MDETAAEIIECLIDGYDGGDASAETAAELRRIARTLGGLPIHLDSGGFSLLRPDLEIWLVTWEGVVVERSVDPAVRNVVLNEASKRYGELGFLKPEEQPESKLCPVCMGTGKPPGIPEEIARTVVCKCGGLGWIPPESSSIHG